MIYSDLLAAIVPAGNGARRVLVPENWMQGRTAYGGLTAALCLEAALPLAPDLPVRAVQVAFVGPVSGEVTCTPLLLRRGRNTAFITVRMTGQEGILAEAILTLGASRPSSLLLMDMPAPDVPDPGALPAYFRNNQGPAFAMNFEMLLAGGLPPMSGADRGDVTIWMRQRDESARTDAVCLMALADAPPPAAMSMFTTPKKISSMTWMAEFLTSSIATEEGWFLARHVAQSAVDGYSSQEMRLWNSRRQPVMISRQTIAIFD